jgi:hypothetical protein
LKIQLFIKLLFKEMKKIGDRISYEKHEGFFTVIVSTQIDKWKENLILFWLIAWTFCGATFIYYLFNGEINGNEKLTLFVMIIFWLYFEVRITRTYLWRRFGLEFIRIDEDRITIKKSIFGYGRALPIMTTQVKEIIPADLKDKSYAKVFNDSFWLIGKGTIHMITNDDNIYFGSQLEKNDSLKLSKELMKMVNSYR